MIFVTVGTHEQPFNRLIEEIDNLKRDNKIKDDVFVQTGYSTYIPKYCEWSKLIPYSEMERNVAEARIIITHGGPSSFIMPLQIGKIPVVVPRQSKYSEHINDHQLEFVKNVSERMGTIIPVYDVKDLEHILCNYEQVASAMNNGTRSNNKQFNKHFEAIVNSMFE